MPQFTVPLYEHPSETLSSGGKKFVPAKLPSSLVVGERFPNGTWIAQAEIAATTTNGEITFSQPAKALRLTLSDGSTATPNLAAVVTFDAPSVAVRDDWLNTTLVGPRARVLVKEELIIIFKDASGDNTTSAVMGYDFNAAPAGAALGVEILV